MTIASEIMVGAAATCGVVGFIIGTYLGVESGWDVIDIVRYQSNNKIASQSMIFKLAYVSANLIGQPIIGAIGGTLIGATAPISVPIIYGLYKMY